MCRVIFTKVKDNTTRVLLCTLNPNYLPKKYTQSIEEVLKPKVDEDILAVWDIKEGKWKSFRISKVVSFTTEEELVKKEQEEKEEAHTVESKQKEELRKRREAAEKLHEERVAKQKAQIDQARDIINRLREEAKERKSQ
jgi:thymidylate synthase